MADAAKDNAGVIVFPPFLFGGTLLAGMALHLAWPIHPLPALRARVTGALLFVAGALLASWAKQTMRAAGTNIRPDLPSTALVEGGPFRFSRNPLYLSVLLLFAGLSLLANAAAPLLLMLPMIAVLHVGVVKREERYLEAKFGEPYRDYRRRVRRWL